MIKNFIIITLMAGFMFVTIGAIASNQMKIASIEDKVIVKEVALNER